MTDNSLSKITYWDEKAESFGVYVSKIEAYAEFMGVGDALDPVLMANCPTKSEFAVMLFIFCMFTNHYPWSLLCVVCDDDV
jgi:hypothetical protein